MPKKSRQEDAFSLFDGLVLPLKLAHPRGKPVWCSVPNPVPTTTTLQTTLHPPTKVHHHITRSHHWKHAKRDQQTTCARNVTMCAPEHHQGKGAPQVTTLRWPKVSTCASMQAIAVGTARYHLRKGKNKKFITPSRHVRQQLLKQTLEKQDFTRCQPREA